MNEYKKEIEQLQIFNEKNNRHITLIIDRFNDDYWYEEDGRRLSLIEEHEIIMCTEND